MTVRVTARLTLPMAARRLRRLLCSAVSDDIFYFLHIFGSNFVVVCISIAAEGLQRFFGERLFEFIIQVIFGAVLDEMQNDMITTFCL